MFEIASFIYKYLTPQPSWSLKIATQWNFLDLFIMKYICVYVYIHTHTHTEKGARSSGLLSSNDLLTKSNSVSIFQILRLSDHSGMHQSAPVTGSCTGWKSLRNLLTPFAKLAVNSLLEIPLPREGNPKPRFSNCGSTRGLLRVIWSSRCSSPTTTPSPCCADSPQAALWPEELIGLCKSKHCKPQHFPHPYPNSIVQKQQYWHRWQWKGRGECATEYGHERASSVGNYSRATSSAALGAPQGHCSRTNSSLHHPDQVEDTFQSKMVLGRTELGLKAFVYHHTQSTLCGGSYANIKVPCPFTRKDLSCTSIRTPM